MSLKKLIIAIAVIPATLIYLLKKEFITIRFQVISISLFAPVLLIIYSTPEDFSIRVGIFSLLILIFSVKSASGLPQFHFQKAGKIFLTAFAILSAGALIFCFRGGEITRD